MASLQPKSREMYEFKKQLEELAKYRGRGTELISVYITPGYQVSDVVAKLRDEYGQAANIKSKLTQKNVQAALDRVMHALKGVNKAPGNGIAIFCGNVSEVEGKDDVKLIVVHPPAPIGTQFYRCDSTFQLGPLEDLLGTEGAYGLVVIDGSESTIAVLRGKSTKVLREVRNFAPKKQHHGGQCVHEDTLLTCANGFTVKAKDVKLNDKILAHDFTSGKPVFGKVVNTWKRSAQKAFLVKVQNENVLNVTSEHRIFVLTPNGVIEKFACDLQLNDVLILDNVQINDNSNLQTIVLTSSTSQVIEITPINATGFYYDFEIKTFHNFVANCIVVHNSAARYQRIHDNETEAYYKRVGEAMDAFLEIKNFQGVIVGGAGPNKETFMKLKPFNYQLKILGVVDTGYSDEQGLRELVEKSEDILKEQSAVLEKQLFDRFMNAIIHDSLAIYGLKEVREAIESRKAGSILVTEGLDFKEFNAPNYEKLNKELEDLIALAEEQGIPVEFMSRDTHEGAQFHATFRGLGAFLRYK